GFAFKRTLQPELFGDLSHRREDLFPQQPNIIHAFFVSNGPIVLPETEDSWTQDFQDLADLGNDSLGRAPNELVRLLGVRIQTIDFSPRLFGTQTFVAGEELGTTFGVSELPR